MEDSNIDQYIIKKGLSDKQISQLINYAATDEGLKYTSDQKRFKDKESFDEFSKHILAYYALTDKEDNLLGVIWWDDLQMSALVISSANERSQDLKTESRDSSPLSQNDRGETQNNSSHPGGSATTDRIQDKDSLASLQNDDFIASDYGISFAIRLYGEARGKGLAVEFTAKALENFKQSERFKNHPHPRIWLAVSPENEPAVAVYRKLGFKDLKIDEKHKKLLMILD